MTRAGPLNVLRLRAARDHLRKHVEGINDGDRLPLGAILGMLDGIMAACGSERCDFHDRDGSRCIHAALTTHVHEFSGRLP